MRARFLLVPVVLVAVGGGAPAEPPPGYGPVPAGLDALVGTPSEEQAAERAAAALGSTDGESARQACRDLVAAGPAGARRAAHRLAEGGLSLTAEAMLLVALSASARPEADEVFARAAERGAFEIRAVAAQALGAGRSPLATEVLARLVRDPVPAVRASALRSLFAGEDPHAKATRLALPAGVDEQLLALRLRLHRLRGDEGPELLALAWRTWRGARTPEPRLEAARCLALSGCRAPAETLVWVLLDTGLPEETLGRAHALVHARRGGYDAAGARLAAADAAVALLARRDLPAGVREAVLEAAVSWIAEPAHVAHDDVDQEARDALAMALPDAGAELAPVVSRRLARDAFRDPSHGTRLLAALPPEVAIPALRALADPRGKAVRPVRAAASGVLARLGRVGDESTARALLDRSQPSDLRVDAVHALRLEEPWAVPLLVAALRSSEDSVASHAADVLRTRAEPEARRALEASLLDRAWRPFENGLLPRLVARATDADFAFLERAVLDGSPELRVAVFDQVLSARGSRVRGPKAVALIALARERPELGFAAATIGRALCNVDPVAAVPFVREHLGKYSHPAECVLVRNLQIVSLPAAGELALEIAAKTPDSDKEMLATIENVVFGKWMPKDPVRLDPYWRRMLSGKVDDSLRVAALRELSKIEHLPLADLLVPIVRSTKEDAATREKAIAALRTEPGWHAYEALLWKIASDRTEDDDLRARASAALEGEASPAVRARALAWLEEPLDENTDALRAIARVAGAGASSAEAARLLDLFDTAIAERYAERPYYRSARREPAYDAKVGALGLAIDLSDDAASLDALAARLLDPRFAAWSAEARRIRWLGATSGAAALTGYEDPLPVEVLTQQTSPYGAEAVSPVPLETSTLVSALLGAGSSARRTARLEALPARIERVVADAREKGRLALLSDAYFGALARRMRSGPDGEPTSEPAAEALERALALTTPVDAAEELVACDYAVESLTLASRWEEARVFQARGVRLSARLGVADIPPSTWQRLRLMAADRQPEPSWRRRRALLDLLDAGAAAQAGKTEEARDAIRRALDRAPFEPAVWRQSAWVRTKTRFEPEAAVEDARRAITLLRRRGETVEPRPSGNPLYFGALVEALRAAGRPAEATALLRGED